MDTIETLNTESESSETEKDYPSEIFTEICGMYPFLDKNEYAKFIKDVQNITTTDPLKEIQETLKLLHNPHARVEKIGKEYFKSREELDPNLKPTSETIDNVLYLKIPTFWGLKLEDLEKVFVDFTEKSEGLIIDLRNNTGGLRQPGRQFVEKYLAKPGRYETGVKVVRKPESGLWDTKSYMESDNDLYYNKPIVILTNKRTVSSSERLITDLRAASKCTVVGTETWGGSSGRVETIVEVNSKKYMVIIPRWRFFLPGEAKPLEETKIKPDIEYAKDNIVKFSVSYIKNKLSEKL